MALNKYERLHNAISIHAASGGILPDGDRICNECHGAGLRAGSTMDNPRVCDVCHGHGTLTPARYQKQIEEFRVR